MKCGEEKPACIRCSNTGRKCEYEGQISAPFAKSALSPSPNTVWRERRAFAYYFQQAAPCVGGGLDAEFWRTIVPQVCRSEPAVSDAVISISALFESPEPCPDLVLSRSPRALNQSHQDALGWYSRAVSVVRQRINQGNIDTFVGLISCMLFICIEALQGSVDTALQLYQQGVHLIRDFRTQVASRTVSAMQASWLEDTIVPIFDRLGTVALSVSGIPVTALLRDTERAAIQGFTSLKSARETIVLLAGETRIFQLNYEEYCSNPSAEGAPTLSELSNQQSILLATLRSWHMAFTRLMDDLATKGISLQETGTGALLSTYYEMQLIILETGLSSLQTATDSYLPNFQNIISQSRLALEASARPDGTQPPYSFDIGVGLPLWFTCLRCRDPTTRREATALLRLAPQVQGFHKSEPIASFGERIIFLEEQKALAASANREMAPESSSTTIGLHPDADTNASAAEIVPEEARIGPIGVFRSTVDAYPGVPEQEMMIQGDYATDRTFLRFSRNERSPDTGGWQSVNECIPFDV